MLDNYLSVNNFKIVSSEDLYKIASAELDKKSVELILDNISKLLLEKADEKPNVLIKYKWLKQFLIWNISPEKSQIKFQNYFLIQESVALNDSVGK